MPGVYDSNTSIQFTNGLARMLYLYVDEWGSFAILTEKVLGQKCSRASLSALGMRYYLVVKVRYRLGSRYC